MMRTERAYFDAYKIACATLGLTVQFREAPGRGHAAIMVTGPLGTRKQPITGTPRERDDVRRAEHARRDAKVMARLLGALP